MRKHTVGDRVQWSREMYRIHFRNRPIDHGTVEVVDGQNVKVRADHDGSLVTGPWSVFHALPPLEDNRGLRDRENVENSRRKR